MPYFDDEFDSVGERAARGEDGKTYYVPGDMTYEEWKKSFVDDGVSDEKFTTKENRQMDRWKYLILSLRRRKTL